MKWVHALLILLIIPVQAYASPNTNLAPYFGRYELTAESRQFLVAKGYTSKDLENFSPMYVLAGVNGLDVETHYYPNVPLSPVKSGAHGFQNTQRELRLVFQVPENVPQGLATGVSATFGRFKGNYRRTEPSSPEPYEASGINLELLNQAWSMIQAGKYKNIHSLLVIKDGKTVFEEYFNGSDATHQHQIRSAGKSISAILIGIAIDQGYLTGVDQNITPFYPEYQPKSGWPEGLNKVDIKALLTMTSGFDCNDLQSNFKCEIEMFESDDWIEYALTRPIIQPPNRHYAYNSSSLMLLNGAIRVPARMTVSQFADKYLFGPLGISGNYWRYSPKGRAFMGGSSRMTSRDMAKIGMLYLNKGQWNGRQIVTASWVEESTRQHVITDDHFGYGYLWWRGETFVLGKKIQTVFASGNGGQRIFIFPALNAVVVFTAGNYNNAWASQEFDILERHVIPALMPASSPPPADPVTSPSCSEIAGTYQSEDITLFVTRAGNTVHVQRKGGNKTVLKQINPTLFHYFTPDYSSYFKFITNAQGVFDTLEYCRRFAKIAFTRTETE